MKNGVLKDGVRLIAFLGCFLIGLAAFPAWSANELCDSDLRQRLTEALKRNAAKTQDVLQNTITPPASRDEIANTPCVSKELDKITGQFSNAASGLGGMVNISGPGSNIVNKFFQSGFESLNEAAGFLPKMLDFQSQASGVLGDLLGSLGGTDAFSSELCGMMADMVIKFIQCQMPMELPDLGSIDISLNQLMPQGCAGNAARDALYGDGLLQQMENLSQPIVLNNGKLSGGTASYRNGN